MTVSLAQQTAVGSPVVTFGALGTFVLITLAVVVRCRRSTRSASDFYTGGRSFTGAQNGAALAGDYLSATAFLGVAGAVAVYGYDGMLYATGMFVAWLVALLLVAEWLRNSGRYTIGDVLGFRLRRREVSAASATATLLVSVLLLVAQLAGAGGLIALLLGIPDSDRAGQSIVIAAVGAVMTGYVLVGGMRGVTWVQILKANLLIVVMLALAAWILGRFGFDISTLLGQAVRNSPHAGERLLAPGLLYGRTELSKLDFLSLSLALLLGPASLPHILMRFATGPDAAAARRSVVWAISLVGGFFLMVLVVGYGAAALVGAETILASPGASNSAVPLLAHRLGGPLMLGVVGAVGFATILAVVAGLTITASASFAHDGYANAIKRRRVEPAEELRVARRTASAVGVLATGGGVLANGQNVAVLVALAFAVAASAIMPTLLYSLFWRRFNTTGALYGMYGGMAVAMILVIVSPAVSGSKGSMLPGVDFAFFPLVNPGIVAIPAAFLLGAFGTWMGPRDAYPRQRFAEMEVRALTGAGTERGVARPLGVATGVTGRSGRHCMRPTARGRTR